MKGIGILVVILLSMAVMASAEQNSMTLHGTTVICAEEYVTYFTESTFTNAPDFNIESGLEPALSIAAARRIAQKEFSRLREPLISYYLASIRFERFQNTDHWYYLVNYVASDRDWMKIEPYRSKLETDPDDRARAPRIMISVLLDGSVVKQTLHPWGRPPVVHGSSEDGQRRRR